MSKSEATSRTRRRLLALGLATIAVPGLLFLRGRRERSEVWLKTVVRRHVAGVEIDEQSLSRFVQDIASSGLLHSHRRQLIMLAGSALPSLSSHVDPIRERVARLERVVVTEFLIGSNFFHVDDPKVELIVYSRSGAGCRNPFATFVPS